MPGTVLSDFTFYSFSKYSLETYYRPSSALENERKALPSGAYVLGSVHS